jgi:hypothetical protein
MRCKTTTASAILFAREQYAVVQPSTDYTGNRAVRIEVDSHLSVTYQFRISTVRSVRRRCVNSAI